MRILYPYQEDVVEYLKTHNNAALYAEMRLGKSLCTIRALKNIPGRKLIICPKSVIPTWCEELKLEKVNNYWWGNTTNYRQANRNLLDHITPQWIILNYEALKTFDVNIGKLFNHIIIDESVNIKNPKAEITKRCLSFFQNAERKIILSGNPAPNTPIEYFTQMQFLYGEWLGCKNYWLFRRRYFSSDIQGWGWFPRASSKEVFKKDLQQRCYFLSRKDVGVENKKVYEKRYVTMPPKLEKEYTRMEKEFVMNLPDGKELEVKYILSQLTYLQEMCGGFCKDQAMSNFKIKEVVNLLEGELKGQQVLIWCRFRWEIDAIEKALDSVDVRTITGDTPLSRRKDYQLMFNKHDLNILILQINTSRYGLNLANADTAIYYSNEYSYDSRSQSEARIQSNNKKQPLLYIDLVNKGKIDEKILQKLQHKEKNAQFYLDVVKELKEKYK